VSGQPDSLPGPGDTAAEEAAALVRERTDLVPAVGIILGSGLGPAADRIEEVAAFPFEGLPGFPPTSVPGHAGRLVLGQLAGVPVAAFLGRVHFYEGHPMARCTMPVRLARRLGARTMVLTASVGALDRALAPGAIVGGTDHINLMGENPLRGWKNPDGSPPFLDVSRLYDPDLAAIADEEVRTMGIAAGRGVYVAVPGPSYETGAEIEFMREAGGTVVGMSVVPEALAAGVLGMRVLALFSVTNAVGGEVSHHDVVRVGAQVGVRLSELLRRILPRIAVSGATAGEIHS
jgi:purine-nucleoside phosphorylase